jgi:kynureninase
MARSGQGKRRSEDALPDRQADVLTDALGSLTPLTVREQFATQHLGRYLASHAVGPPTVAATQALIHGFATPWQTQGLDAWDTWLGTLSGFREDLAELLGGDAESYCPQVSISAAFAALLGAFPRPAATRNVWLAHETTFPSLGFVLARAERLGLRCRLIPTAHDPSDPQTWADAMTEDVCGALVMHVHSNSGKIAPVGEISSLGRERDIRIVVDVAQSAGVLPFSVESDGGDAVIGTCVKWLCGGPGACFLWVRPDAAASLQPMNIGWFSHENPFEFDIHRFRDARGAARFWGGTPSIAPFVGAAASLRTICSIGVDTVGRVNRTLTQRFVDGLPPRWRDALDLRRNGATLCLDAADFLPRLQDSLKATNIRFDVRGRIVRLSFHVFNTADDADCASSAWRHATH